MTWRSSVTPCDWERHASPLESAELVSDLVPRPIIVQCELGTRNQHRDQPRDDHGFSGQKWARGKWPPKKNIITLGSAAIGHRHKHEKTLGYDGIMNKTRTWLRILSLVFAVVKHEEFGCPRLEDDDNANCPSVPSAESRESHGRLAGPNDLTLLRRRCRKFDCRYRWNDQMTKNRITTG